MKRLSTLLLTFLLMIPSLLAQTGKSRPLIAKGASPVLVSSEFKFTEGPAVDPHGNVFFTDQPTNRIMKWSPDEGITVYMEPAGRANGLYFDNEGNLLACADEKNELWMIDKDKNVTVLVRDFKGKKLNGPNDVWVHPGGAVYFTDPFYKRPYWTHTEKEIEEENVYYLSADGENIFVAHDDFKRPNGIIGTPDGKTLYVADIGAGKTYSFKIGADGKLSDRKLFAPMGSDGMTIDRKGNVYLTGKGITVFDASGSEIAHIDVNEPWTANVCFGGKDLKTLFITASRSVYTLRMNVTGVGYKKR